MLLLFKTLLAVGSIGCKLIDANFQSIALDIRFQETFKSDKCVPVALRNFFEHLADHLLTKARRSAIEGRFMKWKARDYELPSTVRFMGDFLPLWIFLLHRIF
jgi:hypothetical protein